MFPAFLFLIDIYNIFSFGYFPGDMQTKSTMNCNFGHIDSNVPKIFYEKNSTTPYLTNKFKSITKKKCWGKFSGSGSIWNEMGWDDAASWDPSSDRSKFIINYKPEVYSLSQFFLWVDFQKTISSLKLYWCHSPALQVFLHNMVSNSWLHLNTSHCSFKYHVHYYIHVLTIALCYF